MASSLVRPTPENSKIFCNRKHSYNRNNGYDRKIFCIRNVFITENIFMIEIMIRIGNKLELSCAKLRASINLSVLAVLV